MTTVKNRLRAIEPRTSDSSPVTAKSTNGTNNPMVNRRGWLIGRYINTDATAAQKTSVNCLISRSRITRTAPGTASHKNGERDITKSHSGGGGVILCEIQSANWEFVRTAQ